MKKGITIDDVARQAGVSPATVSRVLNKNRKVLPELRERVLTAAKELSYKPNYFSKALASKRSQSIGVVIRSFGGFYFGELLQTLERQMRDHGKQLLVVNGEGIKEQEENAVNSLIARGCESIILYADHIDEKHLLEINDSGTPVISVNRMIDGIANQCVKFDTIKAGYMASKHLLELGHRQIAYLTGMQSEQFSIDRLLGHKQACEEYGVQVDPELLFESQYSPKDSVDATHRLLDSGKKFTAVIYFNDELALSSMKVLQERGLKIPEDVSVIGFDNHVFAPYLSPALTTIAIPVTQTADVLTEMALKLADGEPLESQYDIQPKLFVRESTAKLG